MTTFHNTDDSKDAPGAVVTQRVCVVGAGYVGLTAAAGLAELGHDVACLEADPARLATLQAGGIPIHEPGLDELVRTHMAAGRLRFTGEVAEAVAGAGIALLCVGTPPRPDGDPDLRQLGNAAIQVTRAAISDLVLVVKSTVPPGSCEALELLAGGHAPEGVAVSVASNPEFLREGEALFDFFNPDRVVIGADDPTTRERVSGLYPSTWPTLHCDRRSAELVKYAANTFLALKISFANEVAALSESLGAESHKVLTGVGLDNRIGGDFLSPGPGFGGSCLPKDLSGFIAVSDSVGQPAPLARAAQVVNRNAGSAMVDKLEALLGSLAGRRIGVLGLAFKAGTGDTRFSPALRLIKELSERGAVLVASDPLARVSGDVVEQAEDPYEVAQAADALVVATGWAAYRELDPERLRSVMTGHVVLDAVNVLDPDAFGRAGLDVYGVGRGRPTSFTPVPWRPLEWMLDADGSPSQPAELPVAS